MHAKSALIFLATAVAGVTADTPVDFASFIKDKGLSENPSCGQMKDALGAKQWGIWMPGPPATVDGKCGKGYLDNLRGGTGVITSWTCHSYNGNGDQVGDMDEGVVGQGMKFWTNAFATARNIQDAMKKAGGDEMAPPCDAPDPIVMVLP